MQQYLSLSQHGFSSGWFLPISFFIVHRYPSRSNVVMSVVVLLFCFVCYQRFLILYISNVHVSHGSVHFSVYLPVWMLFVLLFCVGVKERKMCLFEGWRCLYKIWQLHCLIVRFWYFIHISISDQLLLDLLIYFYCVMYENDLIELVFLFLKCCFNFLIWPF